MEREITGRHSVIAVYHRIRPSESRLQSLLLCVLPVHHLRLLVSYHPFLCQDMPREDEYDFLFKGKRLGKQ